MYISKKKHNDCWLYAKLIADYRLVRLFIYGIGHLFYLRPNIQTAVVSYSHVRDAY